MVVYRQHTKQGFIQQFWEKAPSQKLKKNDRLKVKIGKN